MKNRITLALAFVLLTALAANAQLRRCGTTEHMDYLRKKNPVMEEQLRKAEGKIRNYLAKQTQPAAQRMQVVVTIPVVVHVVWKTAIQNISDAQIESQIDVLNEDFRRLNADAVNTPSYFQSVAADVEFEFCLAQTDPNGNPTNGIVRVQTNDNSFSDDDQIKFTAQGGDDAWDVTQYFNMWVGNLSGGLLGYAEFPTSTPSNTFGVVIGYNYFGRIGTVSNPYDLGRTATHEVGHCFNLYHIWGDDGNACTGSDQVNDTPNQGNENYACSGITISCTNGPNGDMYQNYMDYSDDACMNLFTLDQKARMQAALTNFYPSLITSTVCSPLVVVNNDAGVFSIAQPSGTVCSGTVIPEVTIRNFGANTLTTATINYQVDAGTINTYTWNGNLASLTSTNVTLPSVTTSAGNHTITIYTSNPNGVTDGNAANDSKSSPFNVLTAGLALPITDGIESATFPSPNFTINNPDASITWQRTNTASHSGAYSLYMDNFDYGANGEVDELVTYADLTSVSNPQLSFWLAYQLYTNPTSPLPFSDTLEVLISTDCGFSYSSIYKKSSTALTTVLPTFSTIEFVPTLASQWRKELISLAPYASSTNAIIRFKHTTDYENNLYLDDINIEQTTNVKTIAAEQLFELYPNPVAESVNVRLNLKENGLLKLYNVLGEKIYERIIAEDDEQILIPVKQFESGVYSITIATDASIATKQLVIKR